MLVNHPRIFFVAPVWEPEDQAPGHVAVAFIVGHVLHGPLQVVGPRPLDGRGVFCTLACWVCGVGWGGDGMLTFDELAHMVDATQLVRGGWGGG